jgi:DUF1009 family protein
MGQIDLGRAMLLCVLVCYRLANIRGTAAMLEDMRTRGDEVVYFQSPQANQNMRVDMPLIGPETALQKPLGWVGDGPKGACWFWTCRKSW